MMQREFYSQAGTSRTEVVALIVMVGCLISVLVTVFVQKKYTTELSLASNQVATLYQNQTVQYFSARKFSYSLTRTENWPDFFSARPPRGKLEKLVGMGSLSEEEAEDLEFEFIPWDNIGFPLNDSSYFIYRVEPEPAYDTIAKPKQESHKNPLHFHAAAIGDLDGDGEAVVLLRSAYINELGFFEGMPSILVSDFKE